MEARSSARVDFWEAFEASLEVLTGELVCLTEADGDDAHRTPCAGHLYRVWGGRKGEKERAGERGRE